MDNQGQVNTGQMPVAGQAPAASAQAVFGAGAQQPIAAGQQQPADAAQQPIAQQEAPTTTQNSLMISEIRDSMLVMKDGSFRSVISCKSINFDLMSSTEREGVEYSFQSFLNALYFDVQILIRSQRVDIGPYIDKLADLRRGQDNMLLNVLMDDYMNFIDILSQEANIMSKEFYIVVPYYSDGDIGKLADQGKGFFKKMFGASGPVVTKINKETFDKAVTEMKNRVDSVVNGMFQIGVRSVRLNTKELSVLFYNFNNPDTALREPLGNFEDVARLYVGRAGAPPQPPAGVAPVQPQPLAPPPQPQPGIGA